LLLILSLVVVVAACLSLASFANTFFFGFPSLCAAQVTKVVVGPLLYTKSEQESVAFGAWSRRRSST